MSTKSTKRGLAWSDWIRRNVPDVAEAEGFKPNRRMDKLLEWHGQKIEIPPSVIADKVPLIVKELLRVNSLGLETLAKGVLPKGQKVGKWLVSSHVPEALVSQAMNAVVPQGFVEFTCCFKDIARMAASKHYESCIKNLYRKQILCYLKDPTIGLFVKRDTKGDFNFRVVARLGLDHKNRQCLAINHYKYYGSGLDFKLLADQAENIFGVPVFGTNRNKELDLNIKIPLEDKVRSEIASLYSYDDAYTGTDRIREGIVGANWLGKKSLE